MTSLNMKCMVRLNNDWRTPIEATLIAFVPSEKRVRPISGGKLDTITTDCIVRLETFDKGNLYQVPLECVTCVQLENETNGQA